MIALQQSSASTSALVEVGGGGKRVIARQLLRAHFSVVAWQAMMKAFGVEQSTQKRGELWKEKHQNLRKELSLPSKRWTTTHECKGISRSQARLLDAIDLTFQLGSHGDESLAGEVMVDLSQQIDGHRRPWRTDGPGLKA